MDRQKGQRLLSRVSEGPQYHESRDGEDDDLDEVRLEQVRQVLLDVVEDPPPQLDRLHQRRQAVVREYDVGGLLRHLGPPHPHCNTYVGPLQGWSVVDPVTGHRNDVILPLPGLDDLQLL